MARAIIRYSFDGEEGKAIRHEIGKRLLSSGRFARHGTASWESTPDTSVPDAISDIRWALEYVQEHPDALDHIWIYIDDPRTGAS